MGRALPRDLPWGDRFRAFGGNLRGKGATGAAKVPTVGYEILAAGLRAVWAPEFWEFPAWARDADLLFADAAGWTRPIRFAGGVGGHLDVLRTAETARRLGVRRLVFAHIGRPTIRALDRGERPPFGEVARDGQVFRLT